ncbi:FKBP-type peptidyl-prolyl cis-trans isomerase [Candidatus Saccharibacteria bacterium]|nr:FKBP-type peptidyl-prolyl cis-trans isomerase [Candidatus Saccharibacteria bacterium]
MIKNDDLRTSPRQRLIIIVIAVFMLVSTFALYAGIVLNYNQSSTNSNLTSAEQARYDELMAEYNSQVEAQTKELSDKYFETFKAYKGKVKSFNAASVNDIKTEDLKVGTGKKITDKEFKDYSAYYIGWLSDEKVFDSSFDDYNNPTSLKAPLSGQTSLIEGWVRGIVGMKIGGVRIVSIPSALGYGSEGQGDTIPANAPLKFIIMAIEPPEEIKPSDELTQLYYKSIGVDLNSTTEEDTTQTEEADTSEE